MGKPDSAERIIYRRGDQSLSDTQLKEIAGLIYDTDRYIYPAMFNTRQESEIVLPRMIRAGDQMFRYENLFVAMDGSKVAGVLIWMRGPLMWDKKIYEQCGGRAKYIDRVVMEYFSLFGEAPENMVSMVRISVREDLRGNGIGSLLMNTFLEEVKGPYQLFVLSDNMRAISFFQGKGFRIRETRPGFSLDYQVPPCFWMTRA